MKKVNMIFWYVNLRYMGFRWVLRFSGFLFDLILKIFKDIIDKLYIFLCKYMYLLLKKLRWLCWRFFKIDEYLMDLNIMFVLLIWD